MKASGRDYIWHQGSREESYLAKVTEQVSRMARSSTSFCYFYCFLLSATSHYISFNYRFSQWFGTFKRQESTSVFLKACVEESVFVVVTLFILLLIHHGLIIAWSSGETADHTWLSLQCQIDVKVTKCSLLPFAMTSLQIGNKQLAEWYHNLSCISLHPLSHSVFIMP